MDIHFILCVIIQYYFIFFLRLFYHWELFKLASVYLWHTHDYGFLFFSTLYFLMEQDAPGPSYIFLAAVSKSFTFPSPTSDLFLLNNNFRNKIFPLETRCAHCFEVPSLLAFWVDRLRKSYACVIQFFIKIFLEQFKVHNKIKRKAQRVFA